MKEKLSRPNALECIFSKHRYHRTDEAWRTSAAWIKGKDINMESQMRMKRRRRTDFVREPIFLNVVRVPNFFWEVGCPFIDVDKFDEFCIEMWIAERTIGHERIIEVLRLIRIHFQSVKLCKLGLRGACEKREGRRKRLVQRYFDSRVAGSCGRWWYSPINNTVSWWWSEEVANLRQFI
jgi:predicted GNAT family N-acyltransferase